MYLGTAVSISKQKKKKKKNMYLWLKCKHHEIRRQSRMPTHVCCMCVCVHRHISASPHGAGSGDQRSTSGVFLTCTLLDLLRQGLRLNLGFTNSARLTSSFPWESVISAPLNSGVTTHQPGFYTHAIDPNSSPHAWPENAIFTEPSPQPGSSMSVFISMFSRPWLRTQFHKY